MLKLFLVSIALMIICQTITKEKVFEPLRARLGGFKTWYGYLISCPYCLSHWLAFGLVPLTDLYLIPTTLPGTSGSIASWFLSSMLLVGTTAFLRIFFWLIDWQERYVQKLNHVMEKDDK